MEEKNQYATVGDDGTIQKILGDHTHRDYKWNKFLTQKSPLGNIIIDPAFSILEADGPIGKLFGHSKSNTLLGKSFFDLFIKNEKERIVHFMRQIGFDKWNILSYIQLHCEGYKSRWVSLYTKKWKRKSENRYTIVFSNTRDLRINPITEEDEDIHACILRMYEEVLEKTGVTLRNSIAQDLFGIRMNLQHFMLTHGYEDRILSIKETLRDVIYNLSDVANDLHPTVLQNTGFLAAVEELIFRFRRESTVIKYKIDPQISMKSPGFQLCCFRVIQDIFRRDFLHQQSRELHLRLLIKNKMTCICLDGFLDPHLDRVETFVVYSDLFFIISNRIAIYSGSVDIKNKKGSNQLIIKMYI